VSDAPHVISIPEFVEIAFRRDPLILFAWALDAIFKLACAKRKLRGDMVGAPRRIHAAWRVVLDLLPDPEIIFCYLGDRTGTI
jgi:hypothetical protein